MSDQIMPIQPIKDGRFVENRIVRTLLDDGPYNMNDLATMDFTDQERTQFAQLIGYSLSGFGELSYVDDETYGAAKILSYGIEKNGEKTRLMTLREDVEEAREGIKKAACALFKIHPDDLST